MTMKTNSNISNNNTVTNGVKAMYEHKSQSASLNVGDDFENIDVSPVKFAGTALDVLQQIANAKIPMAATKGGIAKQMELFERNLNPKNQLRFTESGTGYQMDEVPNELNGSDVKVAPVALRQMVPTGTPVFVESAPGTIRIQHREMVSSLMGVASDDFNTSFRVQPASRVTFPWLSQVANLFETYTFHMLRFIFVPRLPTSSAGQVGLALDFDADDAPASDLTTFSQYQHSVVGSVWSAVTLTVEGEALMKCVRERYTDHNSQQSVYDPLLHDVANLRVAVLTTPVEVLGQIYVEYDITLRTPEPSPVGRLTAIKTTCGATSRIGSAGYSPYGSSAVPGTPLTHDVTYDDIPYEFIEYGGSSYKPWVLSIKQPGTYLVHWQIVCDSYTAGDWDTTAKCQANTRSVQSLVATSGVIFQSNWPVQGWNKVEIALLSTGALHLNVCGVIRITKPNEWFVPFITPDVSAGITGNYLATTVYTTIMDYNGYDAVLALHPRIGLDSLSSQQRSHPLGGGHLLTGKDNRARRSVIGLAAALGKMDIPSVKRLKIKPSKVKSSKKEKRRPKKK